MPAIELQSVSKRFPAQRGWLGLGGVGRKPVLALDRVSLEVPTGSVVALLGPNGSGKTTLLKLISTLLLPDGGKILIDGHDAAAAARQVRRTVGYAVAHERSFFPRLTARENLDFFAVLEEVPRQERAARVQESLSAAGLDEGSETLVMKFSSGMFQRLALARALLKHPPVLLLDEPTRSIDPGASEEFWLRVRRLAGAGTTVLLTTHNFQEAMVADWVALLHHGRMSERRPVASHAAALREWYFAWTGEPGPAQSAARMEA